MSLSTILSIAVFAFPISEISLSIFKRARAETSSGRDRGSMVVIWFVVFGSVAAGMALRGVPAARIQLPVVAIQSTALAMLLLGFAIRWAAIVTLGRFFTVNVVVHEDHRIVDSGLYRHVRHPSYTGLLFEFVGFGIALGSWLSLLLLTVPVAAVLLMRIGVEERALLERFGAEYVAYQSRTARLVPGIY